MTDNALKEDEYEDDEYRAAAAQADDAANELLPDFQWHSTGAAAATATTRASASKCDMSRDLN